MVSVTTTGFGQAAVDVLGRILDDRRADGGPLSPATVICSGSILAISVRRALGRRPGGVAGVTVTTLDRIVDELSARPLAEAGLHPASDIEVQAALRAELGLNPGLFGRVSQHRTTEERLLALHHQLGGLSDEALLRLEDAGTGLAADAMRVLRGARRRTGDGRGRHHLLEIALRGLEWLPAGALGPIVLHLPEPSRPFDIRLMSALARRADCDVVVGVTGDQVIDRRHFARLAAASIQVESAASASAAVSPATLLEVADPDDEVRAAIHDLAAHAALGVPLSQMAVLFSTADPYASLLAEHLDGAGLPWCGPGWRPLATSLYGRLLLRLLRLADGGMDRSAVITFASTAPLVDDDGRPIDVGLWDRLSRQAGVVDGDQWESRLVELRRSVNQPDTASLDGLVAFIAGLGRSLAGPAPDSWQGWADWAIAVLDSHLDATTPWPDDEVVARQRIEQILRQLSDLDAFDREPDLEGFESIVSARLSAQTVPGRPLGQGLLVAPIGAVTGLDFERVALVGLSEGVFPRSPREDSLLPDSMRAESKGLLAPTEAVADLDIRAVAAALAGARQQPLVITARGDLRSIRSRAWPRVLNAQIGTRLTLESHHRNLADHGRPASIEEFGLRALIGHVDGGDPVHTHELASSDGVLSQTLGRTLNRRRGELNRHVGRVGAGIIDPTDRLLSATALETYAGCPRKYLLGRVLRLGDDDRPERIDEITPADRGTLMHAILERFVAESLADDSVPAPGVPWSALDQERLMGIMADLVAAAHAKGITGGRVNTRILERRLRNELQQFIRTDDAMRADRRSTPIHVELGFGIDDEPSEVELPDGRTVRLRGWVDRVDATEDGGLLVIDYKGGSGSSFSGMDADPLDGGRRLQLPLYARVVADKLGRDGPRTALYWLTKKGELKPMELEAELESALDRTVSAALDGISGGLFPAVPGETVGWPRLTFVNCRYCDFDRICPSDRQREWESVRHDPALKPVEVLLEGTSQT